MQNGAVSNRLQHVHAQSCGPAYGQRESGHPAAVMLGVGILGLDRVGQRGEDRLH